MHRLIINADDLGVNAQRSHGIFQCFEFGIVRSASLLPNGSDSDNAAKRARERGLPVGLHLNLTEEYPLSPKGDIETLVDANGHFFDRHRLRQLLEDDAIDKSHIEREVRAQIEWIFDTHGPITHLDGHHHIHLHPSIIAAVMPLLERYGVRFVRIPEELPLPPFGYEVSEEQLSKTSRINTMAHTARDRYAANGFLSTDHFRGLTLVGNASLKNLRHIIAKLPEGTTELMVHPGSPTAYGTPFDLDPQRQTELRMLTDESVPALIAQRKIELCGWGEL